MPSRRRAVPILTLKGNQARTWSLWLAGAVLVAASGISCSHDPTVARNSGAHVVLVTLDGLRPDAINSVNAPTLVRLAKEGAATMNAQTVALSLTLPSHTSMMTGVVPERHLITCNDNSVACDTAHVTVPTIFDLAGQAGYVTAVFVGKSKLIAITHPGSPMRLDLPPASLTSWPSDTVAAHVQAYLTQVMAGTQSKPSLMWIHLPDIDLTGHQKGWMSPEYLAAVRHVDSVFANLWAGLEETLGPDLIIIATSDHGGHDFGHSDGDVNPISRTTPWIAWGRGVTPQLLTGSVNAVDVGPTMLWVLGLTPPTDWDGVPVTRAFPTLFH